MELTCAQLENPATENGLRAYYCRDTFKTILADVCSENADFRETELKEDVIFHLRGKNLSVRYFC